MNPLRRFVSRISIRLMAFNLLLVFLPLAAILVLGTYEVHLLDAQRENLVEQGRLITAMLSHLETPGGAEGEDLVRALGLRGTDEGDDTPRIRILDREGRILVDSERWDDDSARQPPAPRIGRIDRWMARLARPLVRMLRPPQPLESEAVYESGEQMQGPEIVAAAQGRIAAAERLLEDRGVMMYVALPLTSADDAGRVVLLSQSTAAVLEDLDAIRAAIVRVFLASIVLAILLSFVVAMTIVSPLRRLRADAARILDRRGRIRTRFHGAGKADEIGDLARALERLTTRLESHVRFIESFASDVSHELRNPLASVRSATEMLAETDEPEERERFRRMIEREVARMETLIAGVREASLVDALMTREDTYPVAVAEIAEQVLERHQRQRSGKLQFELSAASRDLHVDAREERLDQILDNLIDNAVGFSPAGGTIRVSVHREDEDVVIRVSDQGEGVPPAHTERIFERFFSWRPRDERAKSRHTGLGLAIVRGIVEGYGGALRLVDSELGGATFQVRLPIAGSTPRRISGDDS